MKTQHTPGPWLVNYAEDRFDLKRSTIEIVDGSYDSLNHEQGPLVLAKLNVIPFAPHMDEPLANARLIACAPDLLAALEIILSSTCGDIGEDGYDGCIRIEAKSLDRARETISKAKGVKE